MIKALSTAVLLTAALVSNGTGRQEIRPVPSVPTETDSLSCVGEPTQDLREEFHQTYPLSATGRVRLENINGGVQIKVWDREAVQVDAIKKAYKRERLAEARIEVNSSADHIRIQTEYPNENQSFRGGEGRYDNSAMVEYSLTVPRRAILESIELVNGSLDIDGVEGSVKASSINGRLTARGLASEAKLSTVNGQLHATFTRLDETNGITLGSVNGNLTLVIPSNANASIRAGTVHGGISNDFGLKVKHGEYVGHSLDGQIGTGGPRIKLGNVNGAIKISHAQDGLPLSPAAALPSGQRSRGTDEADVADATNSVVIAESGRVRVETARIAREAQREAQREVDAAMRAAHRDIERAQREIQREQARAQSVAVMENRAKGVGAGKGESHGARYTAQETRSFTVSGAPRVSITTFDGAVKVHGWDKAEVAYTATKSAHHADVLGRITIQAQQQGHAISINASNRNEYGGSVSFDVYVPRQSSLHVSSGDGALNLDGVSGEITLRSGDGSIEVANGGGQLEVNTGDGVIRVIKFDGQVDARTGDGQIDLDGTFNAVSARTGDGTISLSVPAGSSFTIETNAPDEINNEGFIIVEDITPSPRLKRWRIGEGGKVFVLKTGEGKILLRPRQ